MKKSIIICLSILMLLTTPCFASNNAFSPSPILAVAVNIDTDGKNVFGLDFIEAGINRLIQAKFSLVMLDGTVLSGSSVLRDLKKAGIKDFKDAEAARLANFGKENEVPYILLLTLNPMDISADIRAFDVKKGDYIIGKKITQPPAVAESSSGIMDSMLAKFSRLIDNELDELVKTIAKQSID